MTRRQAGWLKLYYDLIQNEKVMTLEPEVAWIWVQLLCVAGEYSQGGVLPHVKGIAFRLHTTPERVSNALITLSERGLVERASGGPDGYRFKMHDWDDWQGKSDSSTERVKRFRERSKGTPETVSKAQTRLDYRQTERQTAHAREPAPPDDRNISTKSEQEKTGLRPMFEPPEDPGRGNGSAQLEQSEFILERIIANYERSLEKGVNRAKVTELWYGLAPAQQIATAEGFLIWLLENSPKAGEPYDPKFVKNLDKLLEEGTLARRKFGPPEVDRHGRPVIDIRPKVLAAWLAGETYGQGQI